MMWWTAEWDGRLIELHAMKHSGGMIAESLTAEFHRTFTRNAVISRIYRLKLGMVGYGKRPAILYPPRKAHKKQIHLGNGALKTSIPLPVEAVEETSFCCTFAELNSNTCRWPIGEPGTPDFCFCGAPPQPEKPYCAAHCARAYDNRWNRRPVNAYKLMSVA
jgi:GcrA cell cycle regulator